MKSLYLLVDLFVIIVPLVFSIHPKIKFYRVWINMLVSIIIVASVFVTWDCIFTSLGVWNFNTRYIMGAYFFNVPIEEVLFFICIPFSCVFTYFCLDKFYEISWNSKMQNIFCTILSLYLLILGLIFSYKLYTSVVFISTSTICIVLKFIFKVDWFGKAVTTYAVLLIPFVCVNGLLTGLGLAEPVVQYNNAEILGIRLLTIPIEDIFYGFELFLLNIFFFRIGGKRHPINETEELHEINAGNERI